MKARKFLFALFFTFSALLTLSLSAAAFSPEDVSAPACATRMVYGQSGAGRELTAYRFGNGKNVLIAGFCIHGFEDNFDRDGQCLVYVADQLMKRLNTERMTIFDYDWTIYILPCMNPDGLLDGYTNNGPGRCTTTSFDKTGKLIGQGIDLNRNFPQNWEQFTSSRYYNGTMPLQAKESIALADFINSVKGKGVNLCIDTHGWYHQIITSNGMDNPLYKIFKSRFPGSSYANCTNSKGYFTSYAAARGYTSCLFEFPSDVFSLAGFLQRNYDKNYIECIMDLLKAYGTQNSHSADCPSKAFTDVIPWSWYHEAVDYTLTDGIFHGVSETSFAPNQAMTRAMLVTILYRMNEKIEEVESPETFAAVKSPEMSGETEDPENPSEDEKPEEPGEDEKPEVIGEEFTDIVIGSWYEEAVRWASTAGIVNGYPDATFRPMQPVSREQLAAIIYRYSQWRGIPTDKTAVLDEFPDFGDVSPFAQEALAWSYQLGLVKGVSSGGEVLLKPKGSATRAQAAAIIMRYNEEE